MGTRQVTVEYSGSTSLDIDEPGIVDELPPDPTDEQIVAAINRDIANTMDTSGDVQPVEHDYRYDRAKLIASVRAEISRRKAEEE